MLRFALVLCQKKKSFCFFFFSSLSFLALAKMDDESSEEEEKKGVTEISDGGVNGVAAVEEEADDPRPDSAAGSGDAD